VEVLLKETGIFRHISYTGILPLAGERGYFSHEVVIHGDMVLNSSREA
jgi:hypothetical protein